MARRILIEMPTIGADPQYAVGSVVIAPPETLSNYVPNTVLSLPSEARAIAIPQMIEALKALRIPPLPDGPLLFCRDSRHPPQNASILTVEQLAVLADSTPEWWPLAAFAAATLGIDPEIIPYRSNAACYSPVAPPIPLMGQDVIENWMFFHQYRKLDPRGLENDVGHFDIYGRCVQEDTEISPVVLVFTYKSRPTRSEHIVTENLRREQQSVSQRVGLSEPQVVPLIIVLPQIPNFKADWEACSRHRGVFPVARHYLNLRSNDNLMYPRIVPCPPRADKVPMFHPGPALYSWISGPETCRYAIFRIAGTWKYYSIIRESHHTDPTIPCAAETMELELHY